MNKKNMKTSKILMNLYSKKIKIIEFGKLDYKLEGDSKIENWENSLIEFETNMKDKISKCEWNNDKIIVSTQKGKMISTMGFYKDKNFCLLPEEAT